MDSQQTENPQILQSFFKKLKSDKAKMKFLSKFTKRWFVIDAQRSTFYYSKTQNSSMLESHHFSEILKFETFKNFGITSDWNNCLRIYTISRTYDLYSASEHVCKIWEMFLATIFEKKEVYEEGQGIAGPLREKLNEILDLERVNVDDMNKKKHQGKYTIKRKNPLSRLTRSLAAASKTGDAKSQYHSLLENTDENGEIV